MTFQTPMVTLALLATLSWPAGGAPAPNAQAAASCSRLFADAGDLEEAAFFASILPFYEPQAVFANMRLAAVRGEAIYNEVERVVKTPADRKRGAQVLFLATADTLDSGHERRWQHVGLNVHTAMKLDPTVREVFEPWVIDVARAEITPRNAMSVLFFLTAIVPAAKVDLVKYKVTYASAPHIAETLLEIAERALETGRPALAAYAALQGFQLDDRLRPRFGEVFAASAKMLARKNPFDANTAITYAFAANPKLVSNDELRWLQQATVSCGRKELLEKYRRDFPAGAHLIEAVRLLRGSLPECPQFRGSYCPVGEGPFHRAIEADSDARMFPGRCIHFRCRAAASRRTSRRELARAAGSILSSSSSLSTGVCRSSRRKARAWESSRRNRK